MTTPPPVLPYPEPDGGATSGHSGSSTSYDLAVWSDSSGLTGTQQRITLNVLAARGPEGATKREVLVEIQKAFPTAHHGGVTRALSNLHNAGQIYRLNEQRVNCKVYVLPAYVNGRETEPYNRNSKHDGTTLYLLNPEQRALAEFVYNQREEDYVCLDGDQIRTLIEILIEATC